MEEQNLTAHLMSICQTDVMPGNALYCISTELFWEWQECGFSLSIYYNEWFLDEQCGKKELSEEIYGKKAFYVTVFWKLTVFFYPLGFVFREK